MLISRILTPLISLASLTLSGCVLFQPPPTVSEKVYEWKHPNKGRALLAVDKKNCQSTALNRYPPILSEKVKPAYQVPSIAKCAPNRPGRTTTCTTPPGTMHPTQFQTVDLNKKERDQNIADCLERLGWEWRDKFEFSPMPLP